MDTGAIKSAVNVDGFGGKSFTYVLTPDGNRLMWLEQEDKFYDSYNAFDVLETCRVLDGISIEEMRADIADKQKTCVEVITKDDIKYFVASVPMEATDWTIMEFVPESILVENSDQFMNMVLVFFLEVTVLFLALFMSILFLAMLSRTRKMLADQRQEANVKLAHAAKRAESANIAKSIFLSNISHDIRTPINGIMGMTAIALKNPDVDEKSRECLTKIDLASQHLLLLVNDVLEMSDVGSGEITLKREPMDIGNVMEACVSSVNAMAEDHGLTVVSAIEPFAHSNLLGDESHLRQVFLRILSNAVKFTPQGGTVTFRAKELSNDGAQAVYQFEIEDNGIGMKPEFLEHIWEAFLQEENGSRTQYEGSGLGMAITKQMVELMDGEISVQSEWGVGTIFTLTLPFTIDMSAENAVVNDTAVSFVGMQVLLAEDNKLNLEIATELLEDERMVVTAVENGQQAVEAFAASPLGTFDLILMDVMMPVMNGLEAAKAIRAMEREDAKTVAIFAITAKALDDDVRKTKEAGMDAHLVKPMDIDVVLKTLAEHIKRSR